MDHFALPDDELAIAPRDAGRLHRNFMGYTTQALRADVVGVGVSAIGDVCGAFAQNVEAARRLYYEALDAGRLPHRARASALTTGRPPCGGPSSRS